MFAVSLSIGGRQGFMIDGVEALLSLEAAYSVSACCDRIQLAADGKRMASSHASFGRLD